MARNGRFAYMQASPAAPPALATGTDTRDISTLTALSANLLGQRTLGSVAEIDFDSAADGRKIQGWIVKPPHFDRREEISAAARDSRRPVREPTARASRRSTSCTPQPATWCCM